ncbi:LysR family transcriptional regulator [Halomonas elongata]|uniref:LysR family transcriptional regulator n=1 Tax=Halomonas elongata TaxID=2746 RepID=UPI0033634D5F
MMNLLHWRLLIAVADAGNVSQAAGRYGITQSGASQAIRQLEDNLGIQIFVREHRRMAVTAAGEQILGSARRMMTELETIQRLSDLARHQDQGKIRLASFPSVFASMLHPPIDAFRRLYPSIDIVHLSGTDTEIDTWLNNGAIDLGVVLNPTDHRQAIPLGRDEWVVALCTSHPLARRATSVGIALHELQNAPFVAATGGCYLHGQTIAQQQGITLNDVRLTVQDWDSAYSLIREGMGLSIVPFSTVPDDAHGLRILPLAEPLYREFGLVAAEPTSPPSAVIRLIDHLQGRFPY